jgi:outer membrane protein assembly factor BamB
MSNMRRLVSFLAAGLVATAGIVTLAPQPVQAAAPVPQDWPTFLHDTARSGASGETFLNTANVTLLKKRWSYLTGGVVAASPTIVGGVVYIGSWDGYEYAIDAKLGTLKWKTFIGITTDANCNPPKIGVTSSATVFNGVVYVGGGDSNWYALDNATGAVLWTVPTGDNSATGAHYNWSSPLIYNGFAYIGIASNCDAPLVQGELLQVSLASHQVVNTVKFVPDGQIGGGVWTSPTADPATNSVFVSTGTLNLQTQTMSEAIVQVDANTLAVKGVWQLPRNQAGLDTDWGTTPTLMTDKNGRLLLAVANKNGVLYAFDRTNLAAGPVWKQTVAFGGDCPPCGDGTISSGAFANGTLYYASGNTTINGVGYRGSVRAFDPATGNILWEHGTDQAVIPAIAYDNGVVIDAEGATLEVLDAATGHSLYDYAAGATIYSAPSIWSGIIYVGSGDGNVYAINVGAPITIAPDANCPAGWTCQDIRNPAPGSESLSGGVLNVTAAGAGVHGTGDQFRFISQPVGGDTQITTAVLSQSVQGNTPQAGLMLRQSGDATSPFYAVEEYPNDLLENLPLPTVRIWYRTSFGGNAIQANLIYPTQYPQYLAIQRVGNLFSAAMSTDGVNYQLIPGSQASVVMPYTLMSGLATDSSVATTGTASYNFNSTAIGPPTISFTPAATATPCPAGWSCQDVGAPSPVGDQALNNGTWTLKGVGPDIAGTLDTFHFVSQALPGDGTISAHFASQQATAPNAKAGLMFRQTFDNASRYYGIFITPSNGIVVQWRVTSNLRTSVLTLPGAAPQYLQLSRYTDPASSITYYTAFTSPDGVNWTPIVGSTVAIPMSGTIQAGMAADANAPRVQSAVTVDTVSISSTSTRPATLCPNGWNCADIGTATVPGDQLVQGGTWTFKAGGPDIWNVYDGFRFAWQKLSGDGTVSARVASMSGGGEWQKAGVMLRFSSDPGSPYYAVFMTPSHGITVQYRTAQDGLTNQVLAAGTAPTYLEAARSTDPQSGQTYYAAYTSSDGVHWSLITGSVIALQMPGFILAGLAADAYAAGTATSVFDTVSIGTQEAIPSVICPTSLTCADIGGATPVGSQTVNGGSLVLQGGGGDIWGTADSFRYAYRTITGDGTVSAHVGSQGATDPWAKAGSMMRASTNAGAPYYAAFVTPANGIAVQYRSAQGGSSSQVLTAGTVPTYLQVARTSSTFTAYTSPDGVTWTAVPGSTVSLPALTGTILSGLAVTSHNVTLLSSVAFDSLTFGSSTPPPVISSVVVAPGPSTATVTWSTSTLADSQVDYGLTSAYGGSTALDPTLVTSHSQTITGLAPNTTYHFMVMSRDASGQLSISGDLTFTTASCPAGWTCVDVGNPTPAGGSSLSNGTWTVLGGGGDIYGTSDAFQYEYQTVAASGNIVARVDSQTNTDPWAKAGLMVRASTDPGSPYYAVFMTPGNGVAVQYRTAQGALTAQIVTAGTVPLYLEVAWTGGTFTAYTSADGVTWSAVGGSSVSLPNLTGSLIGGLAVTSHNVSTLSTVTFDGVSFGGTVPAPVITGVQAGAIQDSTAAIQWSTDTLSSSQVNYGVTAAYGSSTALDPTLLSAHSQTITALSPNTLYHFQVMSRDSSGQLTASGDFTFTTAPVPPNISAVQESGLTGTGATITWSTDTKSDSQVEYGTSTAYGSFSSPDSTLVTAHSVILSGLLGNITYHFAVLSRDVYGQLSTSPDFTFSTTVPPPPVVSNVQATGITGSGATMTWTTSTPATSQVDYGTTTAYGSSTTIDPTLVTTHSQTITGLSPNTLYHFLVAGTDAYSQTGSSTDMSFTSGPPPPVISSVNATINSSTAATITWTTSTPSNSQVNYGTSSAYGSATGLDAALVTSHSEPVTGLTPNTTYHFQVVSVDASGQSSSSTDYSFTTPVAPPPAISNVTATAITSTGATISWTTNTPSTSQVSFGTTTAYGSSTTADPTLVTNHSQSLTGLAPFTQFHFQVISVDAYAQSTTSTDFTFTTSAPPPPQVSNVQASNLSASAATITWTTSTASTSQVNYGTTTAYGSATAQDPTLVTTHSQTLTGLTATTTYHFQVSSTDTYGQTTASADVTFTTTSCPSGWSCADVGAPALIGRESVTSAGTWTITAAGTDIGGVSDQFHFDSQPLGGNGSAFAHVVSQQNTSTWAKAGVMLRQTSDPGSSYYAVLVTPGNGIVVQYRATQGGTTGTAATLAGVAPAYLGVVRSGNTFQAYTSKDGASWTFVAGSTKTIAITGGMLAGLAVTSHNPATLGTVVVDTVSISTTAAPPPYPCPTTWTCADIGGPMPAGSQALSAGAWTIAGGGADIFGTADQFHFVWRGLAGDGSVSAHITAETNTSAWAKAGVMLRQTTDPGSPYYAVFATPGNGIVVQDRTVQGGASTKLTILAGTVPVYLKVTRVGNTFTAYTSADGVTWTLIPGSTKTFAVVGGMLEGLAVTSHNTAADCTATFETVITS